jgi:hypothetical protein
MDADANLAETGLLIDVGQQKLVPVNTSSAADKFPNSWLVRSVPL